MIKAIVSIIPLPKAIYSPNRKENTEQITPPAKPPIHTGNSTSSKVVGVPVIVSKQSQTKTADAIAIKDLNIRRTINS